MQPDSADSERWLAALLQPLPLAGLLLSNRLMMSALTLQYGVDGLISDRHLAFYRERALGGVGLLFSEQLDASPVSVSPFRHALRAYDDRQIARFASVAATLQPFETKFFAQLFSAGAAGASPGSQSAPLRAPSNVPAPGSEPPSPLSTAEIRQIVRDYARSAQNVRAGRLHGVEIHGAHGWLVGQFLSPFYNRRQDEYGGPVEHRCRFALEIGTAIRAAVGKDFPVGIALTYDELMGAEGITPEDTLEQLRVLDGAGVFDFFDLSIGSSHQQHYTIASMAVPEGFPLAFSARAKAAVRPETAIFVSGRIVDPHMAGRAVADGAADVIGMARALVADPHLLPKFRARAGAAITTCIGANYCVSRALGDEPVTCVLNPVTGREGHWRTVPRTAAPLRITVVGAGPAGLRFASVASRAGHRVRVMERESKAGGHLNDLAMLPTRQSWTRAVEDMTRAATAAGVELLLGSEVSANELLRDAADVIVVATGSRWMVPNGVSAQDTRLFAIDQAIRQAVRVGVSPFARHTLIVDSSGGYLPLGLADLLVSRGVRVTLASESESLGHIAWQELELQHVLPRLMQHRVETLVGHRVARVGDGHVDLESTRGAATKRVAGVDTVVFSVARRSVNDLFTELQGRHPNVHCIGDAASPRSTAAVIFEGEAWARGLTVPASPVKCDSAGTPRPERDP
ncbi:MAG: FAD-dependent oxidoreductase [Gammaproteobacteria bacterium]